MENQKVEVLKKGAIVNIQVSAEFYKRIQNLTLFHATQKPEEELNQVLKDLDEDKVEDEWAEHLETLFILSNEIEQKAKEQDLIELVAVKTESKTPSAPQSGDMPQLPA